MADLIHSFIDRKITDLKGQVVEDVM